MPKSNLPKWNEERTNKLQSLVSGEVPVSNETVERVAQELETSTRSISAKLRRLGIAVATAGDKPPKFSEGETEELSSFVNKNQNKYNYKEIASLVCGGKFSAREVQGKLLSLELSSFVKPTEKVVSPKVYSESEEQVLRGLITQGLYLEEIAEKMGREVNSIRGKALSLHTKEGLPIPKQKNVKQKEADPLESITNISELTVSEIAEKIGKTERGVKAMLTHRKLVAKNYDGEKRAAKRAANKD